MNWRTAARSGMWIGVDLGVVEHAVGRLVSPLHNPRLTHGGEQAWDCGQFAHLARSLQRLAHARAVDVCCHEDRVE